MVGERHGELALEGAARRTLNTITSAALAALRAEQGPALPPQLLVAEATNDSLLRGASLRFLLSPALPSAIVL